MEEDNTMKNRWAEHERSVSGVWTELECPDLSNQSLIMTAQNATDICTLQNGYKGDEGQISDTWKKNNTYLWRLVRIRLPLRFHVISGAGLPVALQKKLTIPLSTTFISFGARSILGASAKHRMKLFKKCHELKTFRSYKSYLDCIIRVSCKFLRSELSPVGKRVLVALSHQNGTNPSRQSSKLTFTSNSTNGSWLTRILCFLHALYFV